ncbi:MAG: hypothetical protein QOD61_406, partial [Solirubrobacteraceae bacterium]|nr:hypothetical protein [Solirubrobacteraceae bacterium]
AAGEDPAPAEASGSRGRGFAGGAAAVILTSVGAYLGLQLWRARLNVPFRYEQIDDTKFYLALVKGILEHGSYLHNPSLGAPYGQVLYDFPQGADNLNLALIRVLGVFSSDAGLVTNLFFLATFPLTGLAAYCAFRGLRLGPAVACVCSILFALLPYHFYRHESQVLLSAYYAVPLGAYLFLSLFGPNPPFARRANGPRPLAWASGRSIATVAACVVIGSAGLYYAVFAVLLLLGGAVVALVARRGAGSILAGVVAGAAIAITLGVNLAPSLLYTARHGSDPAVVRRAIETDQLGLRLSDLVLPVHGHRLPGLGNVNARYGAESSPGYCESCNETLGVVGAVGFVLLCLVGLGACAAAAAGPEGVRRIDWQRPYRPAAVGAALAVGIGTIGGISGLIAFLVTPDIRAWNRISLFIAFFSLLAAGVLLETAGRRLRSGRRGSGRRAGVGAGVLLAAVLVVGWLDETTPTFVVDYGGSGSEYASDQAFGRTIQAVMPPGAGIFELPYVPFPEGYHIPGQPPPSAFGTSYELLRPYLSTRGLRFSFGAIKGRPADWEEALSAKPLDVAVAGAAVAGFDGIYVDPRGYGSVVARRVRARLTGLLGAGPVVSPAGDAWLFDARPYAARLRRTTSPAVLAAVREATLNPLRTDCGPTPAALILSNPGRTPRAATFTASVVGPLPGGAKLLITYPDGAVERRMVGPAPVRLERRLVVRPGRSTVGFDVLGGTPFGAAATTPAFVVSEPTLTDGIFARVTASTAAGVPVAGLVGPPCTTLYAASAASQLPGSYPPRPPPTDRPPAF